jgi:hypothetical protein
VRLKEGKMAASEAEDQGISWEHEWEGAARRARNERKLLLVDVEKDN